MLIKPRRRKFTFNTRHFKRYHQIAMVLIRYGFEDIISARIGKNRFNNSHRQWRVIKKKGFSTAERIRMVLEDLGPTFVKFGQIMSNRPDLLSKEIRDELQKLQQHVKPFPGEEAKAIIKAELGNTVEEIFDYFSTEPLASASIAQVHEATLKSGEHVVVKVRRPSICQIIDTDTSIMHDLAIMAESVYPAIENFNPRRLVAEFERAIKKETDFINEANNTIRFKENFKNENNVAVPTVYGEYSTGTILTMSFMEGRSPTDADALTEQNIDPEMVAESIVSSVLKQIFEYGFFHADPHPGNIRVTADNKIGFIDYGIMGYMTPQWRMNMSEVMIAFTRRDVTQLTKMILIITNASPRFEYREQLELEIQELMQEYSYLPLKMINMGAVIQRTLDVIFRYNLRIPSMIYLLSKAIITTEGVARSLNPEFNVVEHMKPYVKKLVREKLSIRKMLNNSYSSSVEMAALLHELPGEMREIIGQVKNGNLEMNMHHKGLDIATFRMKQSTNRLSYAVVLAALIIGSAIIAIAKIPPYWNEIPVIGAFGFIISLLLGFVLLFNIYRDNRAYAKKTKKR